jgi:CHASE3 domain sensor protein
MESLDLKKLAAEVSAQHGIRIDPDDPMMAVITLNRLVFERAVDEAVTRLKMSADEIDRAARRIQVRAGAALAQEVKEFAAAIEQKTASGIDSIVAVAARKQPSGRSLLNAGTIAIVLVWAAVAFVAGVYVGTALFGTGPCKG